MSEVQVLTGEVAGYTTVDSPEHAGSPNINTDMLRPRSAFWLRGSSGRGGSAGVARAGGAAVGSSCQSA
jgi:hypothetical protein